MFVDSRAMEPSGGALTIMVWVAAIVSALVFTIAAFAKLGGAMIGRFEVWGYTPSFAITIGLLELLGAVGLLIPRSAAWAALGLILIMLGALETHVLEGEYLAALGPIVMLGLLGVVLYGRVTGD
jgi:putative oxidoreductase